MASRIGRRELAAFSVALVPYMFLVRCFWWVDEDAFIFFRYAYNFARGSGLRFNPGEQVPVEGYSNFLWVLWSGLIEFLGGDVTFWVPLTSFLAGAILLYRVFVVLRNCLGLDLWLTTLATLTLAVFPPSPCGQQVGWKLFRRLSLSSSPSSTSSSAVKTRGALDWLGSH